ncbi:hypothetical protein [Lentzea flava]|uniref:hypothetical protein n=1 Tax=Lentzea flava TaxID=103732 RepID=UPI00166FC756|nr:hypothetical protein [Lentzea flava]
MIELPDDLRDKIETHLAEGDVLLARFWLRRHCPQTVSSDEVDDTLLALAESKGLPIACTCCGEPGAVFRPHLVLNPTCERCAAQRRTWTCPECGSQIEYDADAGCSSCSSCEARPLWEALPQSVRDEIGEMVDNDRAIPSIYRLMELDGGKRPNTEYMRMVSYRMRLRRADQNRRNSSGSIPRNAS